MVGLLQSDWLSCPGWRGFLLPSDSNLEVPSYHRSRFTSLLLIEVSWRDLRAPPTGLSQLQLYLRFLQLHMLNMFIIQPFFTVLRIDFIDQVSCGVFYHENIDSY